MAEDRSKQKLVIYDKAGTKKAEGEVGANSATLTGIAAGTTVAAGDYKAAFSDGTTESDQVDVPGFEVPAAKAAVTGVAIKPATANVDVGKTVVFSVTFTPDNATDKSGKWSVKDSKVAAIDDNGTATGIKTGTTEVDYTSTDGAKLASATLTVVVPNVAVTGVKVTPDTASVEVGKTITLTASVEPEDATDKSGTWSSKDETIATVDDKGVVTGVKAGTTEIDFVTTDGSKSSGTALTVTEAAG